MSFVLRNLSANAVPLDDLGIEIPALSDFDLTYENPADIANSDDLVANITSGNLVVIDPRDGVTELSASDSIIVIQSHNDPHFGIRGARLNDIDDVDLTGAVAGDVLQLDGTGKFVPIDVPTLGNGISLGDLADVTDPTTHAAGVPYILVGDGAGNHVLEDTNTSTAFIERIQDIAGGMIGTTGDLTITYNDASGTIDYAVQDVFLRNTGDTLDSGTLTIATGASIVVQTGASITITDAPVNPTDAANKDYVDSVAAGLSPRQSCHAATTGNLDATYAHGPSGPGVDQGIGATLTANTNGTIPSIDGVTLGLNDRVLVRAQTNALENGIYHITQLGDANNPWIMERCSCTDENHEVSGAFTFVESGNTYANTGWVLTVDDPNTFQIGTDPIDVYQFSGAGTYTAGPGLGLNGNQFYLDIGNLTSITVDVADEIAFNDVSDGSGVTKKTTISNFINDVGIYTTSTLTASDGVLITGGDIQLDITNLPTNLTAISLSSEIALDPGATGSHIKGTIQDIVSTIDIPYGITSNGLIARTADDVYAARSVIASATASEEGILVVNGDGVAGDITVGLDIQGTTASVTNMTATDQFIMFNGTNNVSVTGQQIADGVSAILGGLGNAYTTITGDTGSATAASSNDTLALVGATNGGIVTVATESAPDTVTFALDIPSLAAGAGTIDLTDEIAVGDGGTSTVKYTFQDMVTDLGIVNGVGAGVGLIVGDGTGNYTNVSIAVDQAGNKDGLTVTNADGTAGNPTLGLDITGTPAAGEILDATDEVIVYNSSALANQKMTGQEIADGVAQVLGFGGLEVSTINGQQVLTLVDPTRGNKKLSVGDTSITWSERNVGNNDWLQIGTAVDAQSGYIVPMNATIVKVTAHTENNRGNTKPIMLYIDGANNGTLFTFSGPAGEDQVVDITLDIDVTQGQKLRLRGGTGGRIEDTVITLWLKWRA